MQVRQCKVCGKGAARYVCQDCGRQVCEECLESRMWVCLECYRRLRHEAPVVKPILWTVPLKLFFVGFLLIFVGIVLVMIAGFVSGGSAGVVWILPFPPIIVGAGWPYPVWALVLTVVLTVLGIVLFILLRKQAGV